VHEQLDAIADKLGRYFRAVKSMPLEAEADICACVYFPQAH
jgi:hypothetical protein